MAVALASKASSGWVDGGSSANCVVTKPTGLAEGDILVLQFQQESNAVQDFSGQGFTTLQSQSQGTAGAIMGNTVAWKVADAADAAASNFTFASNGMSTTHAANLFRVTGGSSTGLTSASGTTVNSASVSISGLTQPTVDNLLLMLVAGTDTNATVSAYAVANSNPTWTEEYDFSTTNSNQHFMAAASATRTSATATGNVTCTVSDATSDTFVALVAIRPTITSSTAETVTLTEAMTAVRVRVSTTAETVTLTEAVETSASRWSNPDKPSEEWDNVAKNG